MPSADVVVERPAENVPAPRQDARQDARRVSFGQRPDRPHELPDDAVVSHLRQSAGWFYGGGGSKWNGRRVCWLRTCERRNANRRRCPLPAVQRVGGFPFVKLNRLLAGEERHLLVQVLLRVRRL